MRVIVSPKVFSIYRGRDGSSDSLPFSEVLGLLYSCTLVDMKASPFIIYTFTDVILFEDGEGP
jgi:hypothetical protein